MLNCLDSEHHDLVLFDFGHIVVVFLFVNLDSKLNRTMILLYYKLYQNVQVDLQTN